jgi:ubiquitin C-terminal hydrolase
MNFKTIAHPQLTQSQFLAMLLGGLGQQYYPPTPALLCNPAHPHSGIANTGNTCYLNSTLQVLKRIQRNLTRHPDPECASSLQLVGATLTSLQNKTLTDQDTQTLYDQFLAKSVFGLAPLATGGLHTQQDAYETLAKLLGILNPLASITTTVTPISGYSPSSKTEAHGIIPIPLNSTTDTQTLHSLLEAEYGNTQKGEFLTGDNRYAVDKDSKIKVDARKTHHLTLPQHPAKQPQVVVFSLKRFDYDHQGQTRVKISTPVTVEEEFIREIGGKFYQFSLVAGIIHGGTAHGGHYWSFAKYPESPGFTVFNDSQVSTHPNASTISGIDTGGYVFAYEVTEIPKATS